MEWKKNDVFQVTITDMGSDGEGIGKIDGYTIFVKDAVIGDVVTAKIMKAKKNYAYARLEKVETPSPFRIQPKCKFARSCGGCQLQALAYEKQLQFKNRKVKNNLMRIGGFSEALLNEITEEPVGMEEPFHYRNKAQFPFGYDKEGNVITGFYAGRTHSIISNTDCALGVPENKQILEMILSFMKEENIPAYREETGTGLLRHALIRKGFFTGQIMVCLVINGEKLPAAEKLTDRLKTIEGMTSISVCINKERTNVIMGTDIRLLWGKERIEDKIGNLTFSISPLSFFQVNPVQTQRIYSQALQYASLTGNETVWDLYCGIGTISLFLAQQAKQVYGVEIIPQAIEDAVANAEKNGIKNAEFFVGRAEEVLPQKYESEGIYADVIVVDPPRKGCDEQCLATMLKMQPKRIVYVSCDSATLARDATFLCENGYELKKVRAFDNFPQSGHVETVCLLSRK
ncbi:MAG: 23S rRNA (uracil(1939)-C(5))-methyltransferase RlmD [Lachnospiraceae bacterium]|nr:23S rRNA (uracil(1939)-C(5))-methyltransferase RlmD [Lachnospiraceae bacterium]